MRPVDVLLVSPWQTGAGASGVVSACRNLAQGLAALPDVAAVTVLSLGEERRSEELDGGIRVEVIPRQTRGALVTNGWPDYLGAARWLRASGFRPSVVHGQGFAGEGLTAVRLARRLRLPSVVTVHGMVDKEARLYADPLRAAMARRVMRQTLESARGVVFVSPYRKGELRLRGSVDARVIPNAIAADVFSVERSAPRPSVLYAGFVGPRKRLLDLVQALPAVRQVVPDAHLRVAGPVSDAAYARRVEAEVADRDLRDAVTFLGPLDPASLRAEYASAGVLALASEEENAPQVIAEAMAAGVPVVATDVGGIRWMVQDGVTGYVVPPRDVSALGDRLATVLSSADGSMSRLGRAEAERFRPETVAAQTVDLYRAVGAT
ncbi:MAG: glycosyltransferase family 4 protein [Actinomycetota bacterium]|nr:glycosyltransferase family 4 protein [Actinomycetota bacterium]